MPNLQDTNSLSNSHECSIKHASINFIINFDRKSITGDVVLTVRSDIASLNRIALDGNKLVIHKVSILDGGITKSLEFSMGEVNSALGQPLLIQLDRIYSKDELFQLNIQYETSPEASALQWLSKEQTSSKMHPFLFSQCQAIHARSFLPCQDTPSVKFTYDANVIVPKGLISLMSASRSGISNVTDCTETHSFEQKMAIPSYLFALFVGALESREIGPRSRVWAEREIVDAAAEEFSDTEKFISTAESLVGPYEWGFYDLLVLPPTFPFGGMENPNVTTITPTLIAGDKSNVDVVAHEISHSWTGNLVTTANWQSFWLNEGFTVFLERKIIGRIHGEDHAKFDAQLGWKELIDSVEHFGEKGPFTALAPNLDGIDPDDAFNTIPYEKGFNFLYYLQSLVGVDKFEVFFKEWVQQHKLHPVTSEDFKAFFLKYFEGEKLDQIDWDTWFYAPGMPPVTPNFDNPLTQASNNLAERWISGEGEFSLKDISDLTAKQIMLFLDVLTLKLDQFSIEKMEKLDSIYNLSKSTNAEIKSRLYEMGLKLNWDKMVEPTLSFLTSQGRMKYVRPLYRALFNSSVGKDAGIKCFLENKHFYHTICARMIEKDLHLQ